MLACWNSHLTTFASMLLDPLVELINALLDLVLNYWTATSHLKTEVFKFADCGMTRSTSDHFKRNGSSTHVCYVKDF